ncbi:MAG TPA: Rieske 2Fe-2S domain-containing protein, partial [Dehalococcoidia bacterium]|jgi:phenylpropionate dioxygenase-like ring-hydroxylating dioxygenase large terminal subunit|nr:Rieske 2Fe-2S domain-containing protein [Dehalococcoidia bacterium]
MLMQEDNELLTRVGPGTPMGTMMRRYWVPALLSWELPEPDCPPVELRLLGEDLVAFRQTDGRIGVVDTRCPHRSASLFWGRVEEQGLRCVYHGWKFDIEGRCVDMPSEPEATNFKHKVSITAYPAIEAGGVVWTYMGPKEKQPPPPLFEWTQAPETHRGMTKVLQETNWLQALEGGIDTVHSNFLHYGKPATGGLTDEIGTTRQRAVGFSKAALVEVVPTDYGYTYAGLRTLPDGGYFVRGYHWVMPWYQLRGYSLDTPKPTVNGHMWVPIDDETTMVYNFMYTYGEEPLSEDQRNLVGTGNQFGVDIDVEDGFRSIRNKRNRYMIDRHVQKTQTFTGIQGTNTQDRAVQESMGTVVDRSYERLGTTDRAIIMSRRLLLQAVKHVQAGGDPPGLGESYYRLRAVEQVIGPDENWLEAMRPRLFQEPEPMPAV